MFILSRQVKAPLKREQWFDAGLPSDQAFSFLSQVSDNNAIINQGLFNFKQSYADLAALDIEFKEPDDWIATLTDQGLAVYNPALGWVLASDNATLIT